MNRYFVFVCLLLNLLYYTKSTAFTEKADTTSGQKKIIEGMTIYKYAIENPYLEKYYFVFDSVGTGGLFLSHWLKTSYETYQYPFIVAPVRKGDVVDINKWRFQIIDWDSYNLWYKVLNKEEKSENAKVPKPIKYGAIYLDSTSVYNKLNIIDENITDTSQLKKVVWEKYKKADLFMDLNIVYDSAYKMLKLEKYAECLNIIDPIINKKDLKFYGLIYMGGVCSIRLAKYDEAEDYFEKMDALLPKNPLGIYGLGVVYFFKEQNKKAEIYLKRLQKQFPEFKYSGILKLEIEKAGDRKPNSKINEDLFEFPSEIYFLEYKDFR